MRTLTPGIRLLTTKDGLRESVGCVGAGACYHATAGEAGRGTLDARIPFS